MQQLWQQLMVIMRLTFSCKSNGNWVMRLEELRLSQPCRTYIAAFRDSKSGKSVPITQFCPEGLATLAAQMTLNRWRRKNGSNMIIIHLRSCHNPLSTCTVWKQPHQNRKTLRVEVNCKKALNKIITRPQILLLEWASSLLWTLQNKKFALRLQTLL